MPMAVARLGFAWASRSAHFRATRLGAKVNDYTVRLRENQMSIPRLSIVLLALAMGALPFTPSA